MSIEWEFYLWDKEVTATDAEINLVETELGIKFPEDFLAVAKYHQGKTPEPCEFTVGSCSDVFNHLLHFRSLGEYKEYSILSTKNALAHYLPQNHIPFAGTPGGNFLCFVYENEESPYVAHVNHELPINDKDCITKVAASFEAFIHEISES